MKKFIKHMLDFLNSNEKDSIKFEIFNQSNSEIVNSFDNHIKQFNNNEKVNSLTFSSFGAFITAYSKKHRTYELTCPFFKQGEEIGTANIIIVMEANLKILEKIFENKFKIVAFYVEHNEVGCIYENKKGNLDYFIEKSLIEIITIKDVTVDLSLLAL